MEFHQGQKINQLCQICHKNQPEEGRKVCEECMTIPKTTTKEAGMHGMKQCYVCFKSKPATDKFFYRSSNNADGLENACKDCRRAKANENRLNPGKPKANPKHSILIDFTDCPWLHKWVSETADTDPATWLKRDLLKRMPAEEVKKAMIERLA